MPFDVAGARSAGYSDSEIASFLGSQSGFDVDGAVKAGYQPAEIIGFLGDIKDRGPVPQGDPATRVSTSTSSDSPTFTASPLPDAGAGRGKINPQEVNTETVSQTADRLDKNVTGSVISGVREMAGAAGIATMAPAKAIDFVHGLITGKDETGAQDYAGRTFVDPNLTAAEQWAPKAEDETHIAGKVLNGLARMAPTLAAAIATGGASAPEQSAMGLDAVRQAIAHGMRSMSVPAFSSGIAKSADLIQKGAPISEAVIAGLTEGATSDITGGLAMSAPGANAATRFAQGAAVGATTGEVARQAQNIAAPDFQTELTPEGLAVSAITGGLMGTSMAHPQERLAPREPVKRTEPAQEPIAPKAEDSAPAETANAPEPVKADPIAKIAQAGSVDEAISAAQEAVKAPVLSGDLLKIRPLKTADVAEQIDAAVKSVDAITTPLPDAARSADQDLRGAEAPAIAREVGNAADEPAISGSVPQDRASELTQTPPPSGVRTSEPANVWFGRSGDGYKTVGDATLALPTREKIAPDLTWKIEQMASGRYRLAGYKDATESAAQATATGGATVRDIALQQQKDAGWNHDWPFIPADLVNPDFRHLVSVDPSLSENEKAQIFEAGKKLGVVPASEPVVMDQTAPTEVKFAPNLPAEQAAADVKQAAAKLQEQKAPTERERIASMEDAARQRREFAEAEKARTAPGARARARAQADNPIKAFLGKYGLSSDLASEYAPGLKERRSAMVQGYGPVFRKSGLQLDELAQRAVESGFLKEPDVNELYSLIQRGMSGERIIPQYAEGAAEAEMERQSASRYEQEVHALDGFVEDDLSEAGYAKAAPDVQDRVRELVAQMHAAGRDSESVLEEVAKKTENATEQDYYDAAEQALHAALSGEGSASASDRSAPSGRESAAPGESQGLSRPSREDILAQQEQAARGELAQRAKDKQAEDKNKAEREQRDIQSRQDSSAEHFQLGQNADDALSGQGSFLDISKRGISQKELDERAAQIKEKYGLAKLRLSRADSTEIELSSIVAPRGELGRGKGTEAMKEIIALADKRGVRIVLDPAARGDESAPGTTSRARLVEFYKRFGFVENRGRNRDDEIFSSMYREPREGEAEDFSNTPSTLSRIAQQGYEPAEVPRVQAARKLSTLLERYNNNKISEGMFQLELQMLSHRMSAASETKQANRSMAERERGADLVREKLIRARRQGDLDSGTVEFGLWLLDKNPDLAEGLGASVRSSGNGSAGRYNPASRIITLFKGKANEGTAVHEILHHSERMMPGDVQTGIANEWSKAFAKAYKAATPEQRAALDKMAESMAGSKTAHDDLVQSFRDGTLDYDKHYQLTNPSEYWAVNATRIMAARHEAQTWIGKAKQWLGEMVEKAKGAFGLSSDAPVIKGLKSVLEGDGSFQSKRMLSNASDLSDAAKAAAVPDEERKPYAGPGAKMIEGAKNAFTSIRDDLLNHVAPMSTGSQEARAAAQTFANDTRVARHQWLRMSEMVKAKYSPEQRKAMWDAADEQNTLMQEGKDTAGKGLDRLDDKQRSTMQTLHAYANDLWKRAQSVGMVEGDGLPFWTPRMAVMVGEDGSFSKPGGEGKKTTSSGVGRNVMTTAPSAMHRKYVGTEESEAALKAKKGDNAEYVHDILTMPLAMSRFEQAIAGRELINQIKEIGLSTGRETVTNAGGPDFFTLDHPAFTSYKPRMITDAEGKVTPALDQNGEMVFDKVPLFISKEFYGPLKAVMSTTDGTVYSGYMLLKSKAMTAIMASPLTHNMVIFGRALAYSPAQVGTGYLYWKGHILAKDEALMQQAIGHGLVPIGANKNSMMDVTDVARGIGRQGSWGDPNESWVNLSMQKLGNLMHEGTGDAIKNKMDALGDFVHHTLLWKQVGALQIGIYNDAYQYLSAKGLSDKSAGPLAAHLANRYAGAVGQENMSEIARKAANVILFSRSFNMGNLGAMKDALYGMPAGLKAKMLQDVGELEGKQALSYATRKARATLVADVGLSVLFLSLAQSAVDKLKKDKTWDEIGQGYVRRLSAMVDGIGSHPLDITQYNPYKISPTSENEPGKEDRVDMGEQIGGRHEYMRLPTGKVVEDMIGWALNPGETFSKKMSPMGKAVWQDFTNDKGFGVPVKDPEGGFWQHVFDVSSNVSKAQLPWDSIKNIYDMAQGKATPLDQDKLTGFATGFSYSQGHPGGPEAQVAAKTQERLDASKKYAMEQVKRDLKYGDVDQARERLETIGFTPREINVMIRRIEDPKSGLSRSARQKFNRHANDEERQLMERQR